MVLAVILIKTIEYVWVGGGGVEVEYILFIEPYRYDNIFLKHNCKIDIYIY